MRNRLLVNAKKQTNRFTDFNSTCETKQKGLNNMKEQ